MYVGLKLTFNSIGKCSSHLRMNANTVNLVHRELFLSQLLLHVFSVSFYTIRNTSYLVTSTSVIICIEIYYRNLFPLWKYILNPLLFKSSSRITSSILNNVKQYSNTLNLAITSSLLRNSQNGLISGHTGSHLVFSTIKVFSGKQRKLFFILTQFKRLRRKLKHSENKQRKRCGMLKTSSMNIY